jgi:hypothetical protein
VVADYLPRSSDPSDAKRKVEAGRRLTA